MRFQILCSTESVFSYIEYITLLAITSVCREVLWQFLWQKYLICLKTLWPEAESNCRPLVFQTSALPTELSGQKRGRRDSNPRPPAWQAGVNSRLYHAPNELNYNLFMCFNNTIFIYNMSVWVYSNTLNTGLDFYFYKRYWHFLLYFILIDF